MYKPWASALPHEGRGPGTRQRWPAPIYTFTRRFAGIPAQTPLPEHAAANSLFLNVASRLCCPCWRLTGDTTAHSTSSAPPGATPGPPVHSHPQTFSSYPLAPCWHPVSSAHPGFLPLNAQPWSIPYPPRDFAHLARLASERTGGHQPPHVICVRSGAWEGQDNCRLPPPLMPPSPHPGT